MIKEKYFDWLCKIVLGNYQVKGVSYNRLIQYLYSREFTYSISMDGNRYEDGINLRYRFGDENGYSDAEVNATLDDRPCSVLEMMIALCLRCEEHIIGEDSYGDRTGQWFWGMILNLGLSSMTDQKYDQYYVKAVVDRFLDRKYEPNGKGGLFTIRRPKYDMRDAEIWYQAMWYLNDILEGEAK